MRIIVTGHTGYIGQYVVARVKELGHTPVLVDPRHPINISDVPEHLIYCSWQGIPNYESIDHYNNVEPAFKFIEKMVRFGVKDVTVIGSCLETLEVQTHYALAKRQLRQKLEQLNVRLKWPQLFYVYGGNEKHYRLFSVVQKAIQNGTNTIQIADCERDFIHVTEAAKHIVNIALQNKVTGRIEVGSGKAIPISDFLNEHFNNLNMVKSYPIPHYEPRVFCSNLAKLNMIYEN